MDGDSIKLHLDQGFGSWKICTRYPGSEKEARYPQGVYRLAGIDTPELSRKDQREAGLLSLSRLNELLSLSSTGDSVIVGTRKEKEHGKYRYMLDLYVDTGKKGPDYEDEKDTWLTTDELKGLLAQTNPGESTTLRALITEVLHHRQDEDRIIHVNEQLVLEGLAKPYHGGKKK
jgi:hypothetical protein